MADEPQTRVVRLAVYIDPTLDKQLRLTCLEHEPRLTLSQGVEEAIRLWIDLQALNGDDDTPIGATR